MDLSIQIINFNAIELISIIEIFIAVILAALLSLKLFLKYRENKNQSVLHFMIIFIFLSSALSFLGFNRMVLFTSNDFFLRLILNNLAIIFSFVVIVLFDIFSFEMTYPSVMKQLTVVVISILVFVSVVFLLNQPTRAISGDFVYSNLVYLITLPFLLVLIGIPIAVLLIFAFRNINKERPEALRILTMGIAQIIITISFIFELLNFQDVTELFVRLGFLVYVFLMYISITMPEWYKNTIKWQG